jgi:hypothetical protein
MNDNPPGIDLLKKDKNSLNRKAIIQALFCIAIHVLGL